MRRWIFMALLLPALAAQPARALDPTVAAGLGAIFGVGAVNLGVLGLQGLPAGSAILGMATVPAEAAVAASRLYATSSAVAGALFADWLYPDNGSHEGRLWSLGAGAIAGTSAFNLLTRPLGVLPFGGAGIDPLPLRIVLGSRLVAVGSAGLGAIGMVAAFDHWDGRRTDYEYMFTLLGGAVAGVAIVNHVGMGQLGTLPLQAGTAALSHYGGAIAGHATAAASRVWVVASSAGGAILADWLYSKRGQ